MNKKKILICGAGSIGKRHLNNLLMQDVEVTVWRKRLGKKQELIDEFEDSISVVDDINKAISNSDAVVVGSEELPAEFEEYLNTLDKPVLKFHNKEEFSEAYLDFYRTKVLS